jgi:hypothetical protein
MFAGPYWDVQSLSEKSVVTMAIAEKVRLHLMAVHLLLGLTSATYRNVESQPEACGSPIEAAMMILGSRA